MAPLEPLYFPFDFHFITLLFPLPSLLDPDLLLFLPVPDYCLPLPLRALQAREIVLHRT